MADDLNELKRVTREILDPDKTLADLVPQATALRDLLERQPHFNIDPLQDVGTGSSRHDSGLAVSPAVAAICLRDLFRTVAFIRGLHQAVMESRHSDRPTRVLYAGCGPYALLALPLMSLLAPRQLQFVLIDIHQPCLESAQALINSFGFGGHVEALLCEDASRYRIPAAQRPDVIVTETMAACLNNEPQVTIARHLLSQVPEARLVPHSVTIEAWLLNSAKEHLLMPADHTGPIPAPERDRLYLGKVFELDAASIHAWSSVTGDSLPAARLQMPMSVAPRYRPHLLTRITIYGDHSLQDYNSSLTLPRPMGEECLAASTLQFCYLLGAHPRLVYKVVA